MQLPETVKLTPGKRVLFLTKDPELIRRQIAGENLRMEDLKVGDLLDDINIGTLMGDHAMLERLQRGEAIPLAEFTKGCDAVTQLVIRHGGLFPFSKALAAGQIKLPQTNTGPRPMTMAEKILAAHLVNSA